MSKKQCSVFKQIYNFIQNITNCETYHTHHTENKWSKRLDIITATILLTELSCSILHCRNKMYSEHNSQTITEKLQITHLIECEILKLKNYR